MPLPLRRVEPTHVSRGVLPERVRVPNDLEATANGSLSNVILQLSSLSHHAEELFTDLIQVGSEIANRANNLQARIDRLAVKVVQLDGANEESASMQESLNTKPFQSSMSFDQQVVSRPTLPPAMLKTYHSCDKPPPLDKLNVYRDDGKDGLKFYTDPSYFFDLWRQEMLKDTEKVVKKHQSVEQHEPHKPKNEGGQRHKKRVRQPHNTRERQKHIVIEHGEHIMPGVEYSRPGNTVPEVPDAVVPLPPDTNALMQQHRQNAVARPSSIDIDAKGLPSPNYNESPYGNGNIGDLQPRGGDFRFHMNHHHLNRTLSQNQYEHEAYSYAHPSQSINQRYYSHGTPPPPAYSDSSTVSLNAYSNSRSSLGMISNSSTPRGTPAGSSTPNNLSNGYGFRPSQPPPAPPPGYNGTPPGSHSGTPTRSMRGMNSRDTLPPPPPPPTEIENQSQLQHNGHNHNQYNGNQGLGYDRNSVMPPPPPPPVEDETDEPLPPPPPTPDQDHNHSGRGPMMPEDQLPPSPPPPPPEAPAPPPPPPMTSAPPPPVVGNGNLVKAEKKNPPAPAWDGRSELLKAIRDGIELRKVDNKKEVRTEDKTGSTYCDVASILARRVAVEMSDSDSESAESEYDSDGWDEASA